MDSWTIDLHLDRRTVGENGALDVKALGGVAVGVDGVGGALSGGRWRSRGRAGECRQFMRTQSQTVSTYLV